MSRRRKQPQHPKPCHLCGGAIGMDRYNRRAICFRCGPSDEMPLEWAHIAPPRPIYFGNLWHAPRGFFK